MLEQVSEIRVDKAPQGFLGVLGQVYFVHFYDVLNGQQSTLGTIYPDGTYAPQNLKRKIKEKKLVNKAFITPENLTLLSKAKRPHPSISR
ncbi:MAG: hypothetical protein AAB437_00695 [Patescibacteria group bacterium]|mgnify:CR=1 FL=1